METKNKYPFGLNHFALYSKGWYKRFNKHSPTNKTIWDDLKVILKLDGYQSYANRDVLHIVLSNCMKVNSRGFTDLIEYTNSISEQQCWKNGYYTSNCQWIENFKDYPTYDYYTSVIYHCMSEISCLSAKELGIDKFVVPDYKKGLPRPNGITDKKLELFT